MFTTRPPGEWISYIGAQVKAMPPEAGKVEVRDSVGNLLADDDSVTLINDLESKARTRN
jgi:protein PhnA